MKRIAPHAFNIIITAIASSICTSIAFIVANTFYRPSGFIAITFGNDLMIILGCIFGLIQGIIISTALYIFKRKVISPLYISLIPSAIIMTLSAQNINNITVVIFTLMNGIGNYLTALISHKRITFAPPK
jgi:hypothetical protein